MSDQVEETNETDENGQPNSSALRKKLEEALEENKTLRKEKRHRVYKDAKLPDGAYDVFDTLYEGDLTVESLQTFAKEKGFALPTDDQTDTANTPDPSAGEDRLAQLNSGAIPARDPSVDDQIQQAEANGDWDTYDRLQAQKVESLRRG